MSLGLSNHRRRQRRQRRMAAFKWTLILLGLFGAGALAYATGAELARVEVRRLETRVESFKTELAEAEADIERLRDALATAEDQRDRWRQRYEAEVPEGRPAALLSQVKGRLNNGVSAERLEFVIANAQAEAACEDGPVTKRFLVRTPLSGGVADSVSFADNTLTVTAEGESARTPQGQPEAWFDPAKPLRLTIARLGGDRETLTQSLPIHHAVVAEGREHRFSVTDGERRGFVEVTWKACAYP